MATYLFLGVKGCLYDEHKANTIATSTRAVGVGNLTTRWHTGIAHLLPDNGPVSVKRWLASQVPSSAGNARAVRLFGGKASRKWLGKVGTRTLYIEPGSPWENRYCESFNGKLRDEFL